LGPFVFSPNPGYVAPLGCHASFLEEITMTITTEQPGRSQFGFRFLCTHLVMTSGIDALVREGTLNPAPYLLRHFRGDWGDVSPADRQANDAALRDGERLLSSYQVTPTLKLWIITEWDRSATTLLLPDEY
jgi:hypothetical protein